MYDAVLLIGFGAPERREDVIPFLENVLRGKRVPPQRIGEVARHYEPFGGVSPLAAQTRALLAALGDELKAHGPQLPVYLGNRNWHPFLADTLREMAAAGVRRAVALVLSAFGSYSSCRQYLEDIEHARNEVGPAAPTIDKLRLFYNHPGFIEPMAEQVAAALAGIPAARRDTTALVFTAHSIPAAMARTAPYEKQLVEACRLVAKQAGGPVWQLAYQSRSGPPSQPWLEPDLAECFTRLGQDGRTTDVVLAPIGFLLEHMEVVYDLDVEAKALCARLGIDMLRSGVAGAHPRFVRMIRELILERMEPNPVRLSVGSLGPSPDECAADCCRLGRD